VAIIGARGSGKTALADALAAGCDATDGRLSNASFIMCARDLLDGVRARLSWETGDPSQRPLAETGYDPSLYLRARYLSQKFVEELCSADGLKDDLLSEIERVIFEAHSTLDRDGATDFGERLDLQTAVLREIGRATRRPSPPYLTKSASSKRSGPRLPASSPRSGSGRHRSPAISRAAMPW
jgi:hypothetical protein